MAAAKCTELGGLAHWLFFQLHPLLRPLLPLFQPQRYLQFRELTLFYISCPWVYYSLLRLPGGPCTLLSASGILTHLMRFSRYGTSSKWPFPMSTFFFFLILFHGRAVCFPYSSVSPRLSLFTSMGSNVWLSHFVIHSLSHLAKTRLYPGLHCSHPHSQPTSCFFVTSSSEVVLDHLFSTPFTSSLVQALIPKVFHECIQNHLWDSLSLFTSQCHHLYIPVYIIIQSHWNP